MNPASASLLPLYDLGQVPSPAWGSGSPPDNQSLAAVVSRTPPSPDVLPLTFLQSPLGGHQGLFPPPLLSSPGPPPCLGWTPRGSLPFGMARGKMAVFSRESTGVPRVKAGARGWPCYLSVCPLQDSVGGSTPLWGPQGAMQGSSWIPLLEEEKRSHK